MNIVDELIRAQDEKVRDLVETATDIAGAAVGAGIGLLVGGPPGAVLGAAVDQRPRGHCASWP